MKLTAFKGKAVHFAARVRRWWAASCLGLLLLPGISNFGGARAQAPDPQMPPRMVMNKTAFYLPVLIDDKVRTGLKEIHLYVKDHPSRPWVLKDRKGPTITSFEFRPPHDGEYWFTVATVDKMGRQTPADLSREGPGVIVVHDTQAPQVDIRQLQATAEGQWVQCDVRDANPDLAKTRFEYQTADQVWRCGEIVPGRNDAFIIPAQALFNGMVKVTAVDRAGNVAEQKLNLKTVAGGMSVAGGGQAPPDSCPGGMACHESAPGAQAATANSSPVMAAGNEGPPLPEMGTSPHVDSSVQQAVAWAPSPAAPGGVSAQRQMQVVVDPPVMQGSTPDASRTGGVPANRKIISTTHVALEYQIESVGGSGVGKIEVWITPDQGQSWQRLGEDPDRRSPVEVDLPGEGLYGVSLVVSNGRGFGATPPAPGDTPDWWIEVDVTKPFVELVGVRPGNGDEGAALWITWNARDKNLATECVDLYYSVNREGPWTAIAKNARNDGRYRWAVPQEIGPLAFIRVAVTDRAGNMSKADTPHAIALDDMSRPRAHVVGIAAQNAPTLPPTAGH
jgi:hypothetical protein